MTEEQRCEETSNASTREMRCMMMTIVHDMQEQDRAKVAYAQIDAQANDKAAQAKFMDTFFNIDEELPEEGERTSVVNKHKGLKNENNQWPSPVQLFIQEETSSAACPPSKKAETYKKH